MPIRAVALRVSRITAGLLLLSNAVWAAEHQFYPGTGDDLPQCAMRGNIEPLDVERLRQNVKRGCHQLFVASLGGDVDAALALGRIIRNAQMIVSVREGDKCASACVFIYAGGVTRAPYGPVLIHRPYLLDASSSSFADTQRRFEIMRENVLAFLKEMNVSASLYDKMLQVAPEDAKPLTLDEMEALGMGFDDPVHSEYLDNRKAAVAGISKAEFLAKKQLTKQACGDILATHASLEAAERVGRCWKLQFPEYFVSLGNK